MTKQIRGTSYDQLEKGPLVLSVHRSRRTRSWGARRKQVEDSKVSLWSDTSSSKRKTVATSLLFKILQIFHFQGSLRYESINNLDTKIRSFKLKRQKALCLLRLKQWILMHLVVGRDKTVLLILCHIYQLITYLLFQFFPSLQPSCLRTLHLWQGDKKVSIQGW